MSMAQVRFDYRFVQPSSFDASLPFYRGARGYDAAWAAGHTPMLSDIGVWFFEEFSNHA
jgi:hypothetical protein